MSQDIKTYYEAELGFLRKMGEQFAAENPKIADRLRLSAENCGDPHVERLIEAVALLTSGIRRKLDDEFPEITDALLNILYPHYLAPLPSMGIVQMTLSRAQAGMKDGFAVPQGTSLQSEAVAGGIACTYRTAQALCVMPIEVTEASLRQVMTAADAPVRAAAVLTLTLSSFSSDTPFSQMDLPSLRFFLRGQDPDMQLLYELLLTEVEAVSVSEAAAKAPEVMLAPGSVRPGGMDESEALLPFTHHSFQGYRLLTEYFAFSRKFLFIDVGGLPAALSKVGQTLQLRFYLRRTSPVLEKLITQETFRLGCTPVVNLFQRKCEPLQLTQTQSEYRIEPDSRSPAAYEIYSINRVTATAPDGKSLEFKPLFSVSHESNSNEQNLYWQANRRRAWSGEGKTDVGTDIFLQFSDLAMDPRLAPGWVVEVDALCMNRSLPDHLPSGVGRPTFSLGEGGPVAVQSLMQPTLTRRPALGRDVAWRLISHLALNHGSLLEVQALREALSLYDFAGGAEVRARIDSLVGMKMRRAVARIPGGVAAGWARGVAIDLELNEDTMPNNGGYLFGNILERFLGMYVSMNSFTQLNIHSRKRGELWKWPARASDKILV